MKLNSPLTDLCPGKRITNHNTRKTVVKKFKSSGIPKCEINNITGHTSAQGLDDYDSGDEREEQMISNIIDNSGTATSRNILGLGANCSVTLNIAGDNSAQKSSSISEVNSRENHHPGF